MRVQITNKQREKGITKQRIAREERYLPTGRYRDQDRIEKTAVVGRNDEAAFWGNVLATDHTAARVQLKAGPQYTAA